MQQLVWFQHLHKCAGTSVVALAREAGLRFYPESRNGNPLHNGQLLPIERFSPVELESFIDQCLTDGVEFVATEFGSPDFSVLQRRSDVRTLTVMRDPLKRFVSNYRYDVRCGFTRATSVDRYVGSAGDWTQHEYYVRVFCRELGKGEDPTESHGRKAEDVLASFDCVLAMESSGFDERLARFFSLAETERRRANESKGRNWRMLLGAARRGDLRPLVTALVADERVDEEFAREFRRSNAYDYALYRMVCANKQGPVAAVNVIG